jgi:outer membrane immunogenic protein
MIKSISGLVFSVAMLLATPAFAGEGRVELRSGYVKTTVKVDGNGTFDTGTGANYGTAIGYDFDLGSKLFVGPEASIDFTSAKKTVLGSDISYGRQLALTARFGVKLGQNTKLYLLGGLANSKGKFDGTSDTGTDGFGGIGVQVRVSNRVFLKADYRDVISKSNANDPLRGEFEDQRLLTGIGIRF